MSSTWVLFAAQAATTALAMVIVWVVSGRDATVAALFGGLVAILPALFFAARVSMRRRAPTAKQALGTVYQAELGKLALTALLFFFGTRWFATHFVALMLTCVACLAMNWLILAVATNTDV